MKRATISILLLILSMTLFLFVACIDYTPSDDIPGINKNAVLQIKHDRLNFALGMKVDSAEVISKCDCVLSDDQGNSVTITKEHLTSGKVQYTTFDISTVGKGRQVAVTYKKSSYYITYDVDEYTVKFWEDENTLYQTVKPQASFDSEMNLACGVDLSYYNYGTDSNVIQANADKALRFCGWEDVSGNAVTGPFAIQPPSKDSSLREVNFYARFLTEEEAALFDLSYDERGNKVFGGYGGNAAELQIPESVTFISMETLATLPCQTVIIPSTASVDLPLTGAIRSRNLQVIKVDGNHPKYADFEGGLYNKGLTVLYYYPTVNEEITFPDTMREIAAYALAGSALTEVTLPDATKVLGRYCFEGSALTNLVGFDRVTSIMVGAFENTVFAGEISVEDNGVMYYALPQEDGTVLYAVSSVKDKNITEFIAKEGTVSIPGEAFADCKQLEKVVLGDSIQTIGEMAFYRCSALKTVEWPTTIESVGAYAFYECTSLESLNIPDISSVNASVLSPHTIPAYLLYGCTALTTVTISDDIEIFDSAAFMSCSSLTDINMPKNLKTIGSSALRGSGVENYVMPAGLESIGKSAFSSSQLTTIDLSACTKLTKLPDAIFYTTKISEIFLPESIKVIPKQCFYSCTGLTRIDLTFVEEVGAQAFYNCTNLSEVVWGERLKTILTYGFAKTKLSAVDLPDSLEVVESYAFRNIPTLTEISFGTNVRTIGLYQFDSEKQTFGSIGPAFYECLNLETITVAEGNPYFKTVNGILYGTMLDGHEYDPYSILYWVPSAYNAETLVVPGSVRIVNPYSIYAQKNLVTVTVEEGVEIIGKGTFYAGDPKTPALFAAKNLTTVHLPASMTNLGASIFLNCPGISTVTIAEGNPRYTSDGQYVSDNDTLVLYVGSAETIVIPSYIKVISSAFFMGRTEIAEVVIPDSVTTIADKVFKGCTNLKKITFGNGLENLDSTALAELPNLESVIVHPDNPNFKVVNNVLYTKDGKKLILCVAQNGMTTLTMEAGVEEIGDYAFAYHATLNKIVLPNSVKKLGEYAFYDCQQLAYLETSPALESIGAYAFAYKRNKTETTDNRFCDSLKAVMLYGGLTSIGDNAFDGNYGIEYLYLNTKTIQEAKDIVGLSWKNSAYLTHGCQNFTVGATSLYYNEVKRCIYSESEPTAPEKGYYFWHYVDGVPTLWSTTPTEA